MAENTTQLKQAEFIQTDDSVLIHPSGELAISDSHIYDYEVVWSTVLGWKLRYIPSGDCLLLDEAQAHRLIAAMEKQQNDQGKML